MGPKWAGWPLPRSGRLRLPSVGRAGPLPPGRLALLGLTFAVSCGDPTLDRPRVPQTEWVTEPDHRIGDAVRGDALFGIVPYLRIGPSGQVFVLEALDNRLSVWTPSGVRLFSVGRSGEGPGDFAIPYRIHFGDSWFYVRDQVKFTFFSCGGTLLRTIPNPPTSIGYQGSQIRLDALAPDGSFLGFPSIAAHIRLGLLGDDPIDSLPVFSIRESAEGWVRETVYWNNIRNRSFAITQGSRIAFAGQPFSDAEEYLLEPGTGTVLVARVAGEHLGPGEAELVEFAAEAGDGRSVGDTVWRRRLRFEPIRLTPATVEAAVDRMVETHVRRVDEGEAGRRVLESARRNIEESIHVPEYLPAVRKLFTASSGQVWLLSYETVDTLNVWYSVERGDTVSPPRRVLLPEWFLVHDATETHVWGVWEDELDINYVVGRRLVPPG